MEIFNVFAKIALNMEEFERGLARAAKALEEFAKIVNAKAEAISERMNEIGENFMRCCEQICGAVERTGGAIERFIGMLRNITAPLAFLSAVFGIINGLSKLGLTLSKVTVLLATLGKGIKAIGAVLAGAIGVVAKLGLVFAPIIIKIDQLILRNEEAMEMLGIIWYKIKTFFKENAKDIAAILETLATFASYIFK